eukprot:1316779-Pleurochrysis_carterae.AAC.1
MEDFKNWSRMVQLDLNQKTFPELLENEFKASFDYVMIYCLVQMCPAAGVGVYSLLPMYQTRWTACVAHIADYLTVLRLQLNVKTARAPVAMLYRHQTKAWLLSHLSTWTHKAVTWTEEKYKGNKHRHALKLFQCALHHQTMNVMVSAAAAQDCTLTVYKADA